MTSESPCETCDKVPAIEKRLHEHSVMLTGNGKGVKESVYYRLGQVEDDLKVIKRLAWTVLTAVILMFMTDLYGLVKSTPVGAAVAAVWSALT